MKKKLLLLLVFLFSAAGIILADSTTATRVRNFVNDKANTIPITASYMDSEFDNLITKANSKVLAKSTAPSSPTVGDTWCDTSVTPPFCKVYDGTTWAAMSFTKGADVASSTSMTLGNDGNFFDITGTTTITSITAKAAGFYACMQFDGALTVTDGSNLKLNGNLTTAAETVLCMVSDGTNWFETTRTPATSNTQISGSYRNLKVTRGSVTQVTVTADELVLQNTSSESVRITSVNETIAITTSGASGLDTGSEGSSRWYYIWIIRKSSDGTTDGLISESSSSPTMPAGYDQKALVSAVRNDGSSDFTNFIQEGSDYEYLSPQLAYNGSPTAWSTTLDTSTYVPSALSTRVRGVLWSTTSQDAQITNDNSVSTTSTTQAPNKIVVTSKTSSVDSHFFEMHILTGDTLYMGGSSTIYVYLNGFTINKL